MQVRVPSDNERNIQPPRYIPAEHSHITRTGDVYCFHPQPLSLANDTPAMTQQKRIAIEMHIEGEREAAALDFHDADFSISCQRGGRAGMNTQEWNLPAPYEGLQLAARVGNAIYFMEGIGQKRYFAI